MLVMSHWVPSSLAMSLSTSAFTVRSRRPSQLPINCYPLRLRVWEEVALLIEAIIAKNKEAQSPMHII